MTRMMNEIGRNVRGVRRVWAIGSVLLVSVVLSATSWSQSLTWLGTLPDWGWISATGVSADGAVVVGWAYGSGGYGRAFRWTAARGMEYLGTLGGNESFAYGVSADGAVVVGGARTASGYGRAFRWTAEGGMQNLGTLGGDGSWASGVSADGSVVVGGAANVRGYPRAFRWTAQTGMQDLGTLPGGYWSLAYGVSADGAVVVGYAVDASDYERAFRWTAQTGMQDLGTLPGYDHSWALGVSADGAVVVGAAWNAMYDTAGGYDYRAFRWTAEDGMQNLGTLGGPESLASGVSADGAVVVGWALNASGKARAFRWTAASGMQDLNQLYAALLQNGSYLEWASALSPDGRYIVGTGYNAATGRRKEAFLLDTWRRGDTNGDGCIDESDLLAVLFAFGTPGTGLTRHEDINKDGIVDDADLLEVLFAFGQGC